MVWPWQWSLARQPTVRFKPGNVCFYLFYESSCVLLIGCCIMQWESCPLHGRCQGQALKLTFILGLKMGRECFICKRSITILNEISFFFIFPVLQRETLICVSSSVFEPSLLLCHMSSSDRQYKLNPIGCRDCVGEGKTLTGS